MSDKPVNTLEIERTWLLDRLPDLPGGAIALRIEQGYLKDNPEAELEGRLRRTTHSDGLIICKHTIKRGSGLVRSETEREISIEEFKKHWPDTAGMRLSKTRYVITEDSYTWEIDDFDQINLVLAEVELPDAATLITPPSWLAPHIVRDVTEEKQYRNHQLAIRLAQEQNRQ